MALWNSWSIIRQCFFFGLAHITCFLFFSRFGQYAFCSTHMPFATRHVYFGNWKEQMNAAPFNWILNKQYLHYKACQYKYQYARTHTHSFIIFRIEFVIIYHSYCVYGSRNLMYTMPLLIKNQWTNSTHMRDYICWFIYI